MEYNQKLSGLKPIAYLFSIVSSIVIVTILLISITLKIGKGTEKYNQIEEKSYTLGNTICEYFRQNNKNGIITLIDEDKPIYGSKDELIDRVKKTNEFSKCKNFTKVISLDSMAPSNIPNYEFFEVLGNVTLESGESKTITMTFYFNGQGDARLAFISSVSGYRKDDYNLITWLYKMYRF